MITYGIGVLPIIRQLRETHHCVTQTSNADDVGEEGTFKHILAHYKGIQMRGPTRGYFPDPTKIILVVDPRNLPGA